MFIIFCHIIYANSTRKSDANYKLFTTNYKLLDLG